MLVGWIKLYPQTHEYRRALLFRCDECHSAVAETVYEARKLLEEGFEYVCQKADLMLFRKRK